MKRNGELLVVAGEPSGDGLAARVVAELGAESFGIGGADLRAAGTDLVADVGGFAAMGLRAPFASAPTILRAVLDLSRAVRLRRPRVALLVGFSEVNARLALWLKRRAVRVVWYAPPQVWAWRLGRAARIARTVDRLAVLLPFEPDVWQRAGALAEYVGHPAVDGASRARRTGPPNLGPRLVALLPGSRKQEVRAHLPAMLSAVTGCGALDARLVLSAALPKETRDWARRSARARGVSVTSEPMEAAIRGAHAAIVSSGTATLECAARGVSPVIVYRTDRVTHFVAKRLVRVPWIGLPNLVLGRPAFPELVQSDATAERMSDALRAILDDPGGYSAACDETMEALTEGLGGGTAAERVARMVEPWLS
jgi:lipid-A-disaccharide synthase